MLPLQPRPIDATLSVASAARVLGVHPNTVRAWTNQGRLRSFRINDRGDRRFRLRDLEVFLAAAQRRPRPGMTHGVVVTDRLAAGGGGRPPRAAAHARGLAVDHHRGRPGAGDRSHTRHEFPTPGLPLGPRTSTADAAARPAGAAGADLPATEHETIRLLTGMAELVATGLDLDHLLWSTVRLVRDALGCDSASVWEAQGASLRRRAAVGLDHAGRTLRVADGLPGRVHRAGRGMQTLSGASDLRWLGTPAASVIAAPIRVAGTPWGVVAVHTAAEHVVPAWTPPGTRPEDAGLDLLEAVAAEIGVAVRTTSLAETAAAELRLAGALRHVMSDADASLGLEGTLARLVDQAMTTFGADRGALFLHRRNGRVTAQASRGLSKPYIATLQAAPYASLAATATAAHHPVSATGYANDPRAEPDRQAILREGFDTLCVAPLLDAHEPMGLVALYHDTRRVWSPAELETLAAFADRAGSRIREVRHGVKLADQAARLESVERLGSRLGRLEGVEAITGAIVAELRGLIACDTIRVDQVRGDELVCVALHDVRGTGADDPLRWRPDEGISGWVARRRAAQYLPDAGHDPRVAPFEGDAGRDASMLVAPMTFGDQVLGVVSMSRAGIDQFDEDDLHLVVIVAGLAAQALAHAADTDRLRRQSAALERQLHGQRELLRSTESILSTLDPREVLAQIAERLAGVVPADAVSIRTYDRASGSLIPLAEAGHDEDAASQDRRRPDEAASAVVEANLARLVPGGPGRDARILIPLRVGDRAIGLLTLRRQPAGPPFSPDEFELAQLFAGHVSIAIRNAETHRAVEVRARTDGLTGLLNHGSLLKRLERGVRDGTPFSLIMLDLDGFKAVNDAFGHQAGDRLLARIATTIVGAARGDDLVFRYGGDEFAVVLPSASMRDGLHVAQRVLSAVRSVAPDQPDPVEVEITASVGVAAFPVHARTAGDTLLAADRACLAAKRTGGDRVATAIEGLELAAEVSLQEPTPVDSAGSSRSIADESDPDTA